jgi:hypothetical protein
MGKRHTVSKCNTTAMEEWEGPELVSEGQHHEGVRRSLSRCQRVTAMEEGGSPEQDKIGWWAVN